MENTQTQPNEPHVIFFYPPIETNFLGHQMAEIYKDKIYQPYLPLRKEGTVCLDVGGNLGMTAYYFSQYFDKVITLEPSTSHCDLLIKMIAVNHIQNVTVLKKALYIKEGLFGFGGPKDNKTMRSLHMATWQDGKEEEKVETITLDKLFEDYKIDHVNLMKLDIEGSEVEVLSHPSFKKVADKIDVIIVERHEWSGRHPNQLREALKNANFNIEQIPNSADLVVAKRK